MPGQHWSLAREPDTAECRFAGSWGHVEGRISEIRRIFLSWRDTGKRAGVRRALRTSNGKHELGVQNASTDR